LTTYNGANIVRTIYFVKIHGLKQADQLKNQLNFGCLHQFRPFTE